ncbi:MAG: hypothetical protein G8345_04325 [Magnetococcales bacterium]|nr:hypothetical protein [Magnetococcales bacterium]
MSIILGTGLNGLNTVFDSAATTNYDYSLQSNWDTLDAAFNTLELEAEIVQFSSTQVVIGAGDYLLQISGSNLSLAGIGLGDLLDGITEAELSQVTGTLSGARFYQGATLSGSNISGGTLLASMTLGSQQIAFSTGNYSVTLNGSFTTDIAQFNILAGILDQNYNGSQLAITNALVQRGGNDMFEFQVNGTSLELSFYDLDLLYTLSGDAFPSSLTVSQINQLLAQTWDPTEPQVSALTMTRISNNQLILQADADNQLLGDVLDAIDNQAGDLIAQSLLVNTYLDGSSLDGNITIANGTFQYNGLSLPMSDPQFRVVAGGAGDDSLTMGNWQMVQQTGSSTPVIPWELMDGTWLDMSDNGRYVLLQGGALPSVPSYWNEYFQDDLFVVDLFNNTPLRVNNGVNNEKANGSTQGASLSGSGRYVAFASSATNLTSDTNDGSAYQIFLVDNLLDVTTLVSVNGSSVLGNASSTNPYLSADGQSIAFDSDAGNLVSGDTNGVSDVFFWQSGSLSRISVASNGSQANGNSAVKGISANGQYVLFASDASNLVAGDTNSSTDLFLRDTLNNTTILISMTYAGEFGYGVINWDESLDPVLSPDGRTVLFASEDWNMAADYEYDRLQDWNWFNWYVRDTVAGTTSLLPYTSQQTPIFSADGSSLFLLDPDREVAEGEEFDPRYALQNSSAYAVFGGGGDDLMRGGLGDDRFNGGSGSNQLIGLGGNDLYITDDTSDQIVEAENGGVDTILSQVTFTLPDQVENLRLANGATTGTGNILNNLLMGNSTNNSLFGGAGNDTLVGGGGNDTMNGEDGNDQYLVDSTNDTVNEAAQQGTDTVISQVSLTLADNVENLTLFGRRGVSNLRSLQGKTYLLQSQAGWQDLTATGNAENNRLQGNNGDNSLIGGDGNDTLSGGLGNDTMRGDGGNDVFHFFSPNDGLDTIQDFTSGDLLSFDRNHFGQLAAIDITNFVANSSGQATDSQHRIVFNTTNGLLSFDADGAGGDAARAIATLSGVSSLSASDCILVGDFNLPLVLVNNQLTVEENVATDFYLGTLAVEGYAPGDVSFTLLRGGNGNDFFNVAADGDITTVADIDYETLPSCSLHVQMTYGNLIADGIVIINVSDIQNEQTGVTEIVENVANGYSWQGYVGSRSQIDAFYFSRNVTSTFDMWLGDLDADLDLALFDSRGSLLQSSTQGGDYNEYLEMILGPGSYSVEVNSAGGSSNYFLQLSAVATGGANDNSATNATNLGTLTDGNNLSQWQWVGSLDTTDWYQVALTDPGSLFVDLAGRIADATFSVLDGQGNLLFGEDNDFEDFNGWHAYGGSDLSAGTYYIQVTQQSGNSNYNLSLGVNYFYLDNDNTPANATEPYNVAQSVEGLLAGFNSFNGYLGGSDTVDWYRFFVQSTSTVDVGVAGDDTLDADLYLLTTGGSTLAAATNRGTLDTLESTVAPGTYYVRMDHNSGLSSYTFHMSGISGEPADNSTTNARNLGTLANDDSTIQLGWVGNADSDDWYTFSLSSPGYFQAGLTNLMGALDVALYDGSGSLLVSSYPNGGWFDLDGGLSSNDMTPGTYFVHVFQQNAGNSNYRLSLYWYSPWLDDNNSLATAGQVEEWSGDEDGFLEGLGGSSDALGYGDSVDYYRFQLNATSTVDVVMWNYDGRDLDFSILNESGGTLLNAVTRDSQNGERAETILSAGTYYVAFTPFGSPANYEFEISSIATGGADDNALANARALGVLPEYSTTDAQQWLGAGDTTDWWSFVLQQPASLNATVDFNLAGDYALQILDNSGSTLTTAALNSGDGFELIASTLNLTTGTYFVQLSRTSGASNYNLILNTGDYEQADVYAADVTVGYERSGYLGGSTPDYYTFNLSVTSTLDMWLGGLYGDLDLSLLNNNGSILAAPTQRGSYAEFAETVLAPGSYSIVVQQYNQESSGYTLSASAVQVGGVNDDTTTAAINLGSLSLTDPTRALQWVGNSDVEDWYQFSMVDEGYLYVELSNRLAGADFNVYDDLGNALFTGYQDYEYDNGLFLEGSSYLTVGTYYVQVSSKSGSETNYILSLDANYAYLDNNNSLATAYDFAEFPEFDTVDDSLGNAETVDWYTFSVGTTSNLNLGLLSYSSLDADLTLLTVDGSVLANTSVRNGTDTLDTPIAPGSYAVRVDLYSGASSYFLQISGITDNATDNTTTEARNLGVLENNNSITRDGWVGSSDTVDMFVLTAPYDGYLEFTTNRTIGDVDISLLNSNGSVVATSSGYQSNAGYVNYVNTDVVAAGTYYVEVTTSASGSNYRLFSSWSNPWIDNNNAPAEASLLTENYGDYDDILEGFTSTYTSLGSGDPSDYYRMELQETSTVDVLLQPYYGSTLDFNFTLLDGTGTTTLLSRDQFGTGEDESASQVVSAGTYYVAVGSNGGNGNYNLVVSAVVQSLVDDNSTTQAVNLGQLVSNEQTDTAGWVGNSDGVDYYRFTTEYNGSLYLYLTGLIANADFVLLDTALATVATSNNYGNLDRSLSAGDLTAGTYFVQVYQNDGPSNYELSLNWSNPWLDYDNSREEVYYYLDEDYGNYDDYLEGTATRSAHLGNGDLADYTLFQIRQDSYVNVNLTPSYNTPVDFDLTLLDVNGATLVTSFNRATSGSEGINALLSAGTYYVSASQFSGTDYYSLEFTTQQADSTNDNTLANATSLGSIFPVESDQIYDNEWLGSSDPSDIWKFTLGLPNRINVQFDASLNSDFNLALLGQGGETLATTSVTNGAAMDLTDQDLAAGTYYVRLNTSDEGSIYALEVSSTNYNIYGSFYTDSLYESSGTLDAGQYYYYRLELNDSEDYFAEVSSDSQDVAIQLLNGAGEVQESIYGSNGVANRLSPGTYYVQLQSTASSGTSNYALSSFATDDLGGDAYDPNSQWNADTVLGSGELFYNPGWVGTGDANDYFGFQVADGGASVTFAIQTNGSVDAYLYDENNQSVAVGTSITGSFTSNPFSLAAGSYYLNIGTTSSSDSSYFFTAQS